MPRALRVLSFGAAAAVLAVILRLTRRRSPARRPSTWQPLDA